MQISIAILVGKCTSGISYAKKLVKAFKARVLSYPNSIFEAEPCLVATLTELNAIGLLDNASLVITPNAYNEGKLYDVVPNTTLGDMDVVRATTATRVNEQGLIEVVPRNLLQYSNDFTNATWTKNNATVTSNNIISPDGTLNASLITSTDTSATGIYLLPNLNGTNTWSFYGKKGTARYIFLNTNVPLVAAKFDLQDGVVIGTTGVEATASIQSVGNDWYRCIITSSISIDRFTIFITNNTTVTDISSNVGLNFYLYGTQLEQGSTATTYFPTTTRLNIPRIDYTNGSCPSLLVEPQRTNLVLYSNEFTNSYWNVNSNALRSLSTNLSPQGIANAYRIEAVSGTQVGALETTSIGTIITTSIYVKRVSGSTTFEMVDVNNVATTVNINNQWQRFSVTATATSTNLRNYFRLSNLGDIVEVYGMQTEVGSYASSYIPTVASTVTRNADVISKTGISSLIGQTEGTMFVDAYISIKNEDLNPVVGLITINNNVNNIDNCIIVGIDRPASGVNNKIYTLVQLSGATVAEIFTPTITKGRYKIAFAYKQNDFVLYVNGVQIGTDTSGNVPTCNQVLLGERYNSDPYKLADNINSSQLYKTRLTNTELASLTTI